MVKLDEVFWLEFFKIKKNIYRIENIIHLINEEDPGEAEAEKGAQHLTGYPDHTDVQACYDRRQWMLKGLEAEDGSKLKKMNFVELYFYYRIEETITDIYPYQNG